MVFEEAARLSYQLRQLWPQASALTPKVPAQSDVSPSDAQTHRLSEPASEASPVPCLKEPFKYDAGFETVDASFEFDG